MSRYAHNIHQVHIADGFSSDCDELIHRCLQLETVEYQLFCNIWKDLNFGSIYQGRSSGAEIAELTEELLYIAKHYMVKNTSNFEESVAGLFLVYGLLTLQPFQNFALLRIVPDDVPAINRLEVVARRERRLDILYILGEVLVKFTEYNAAERDRGMDSVIRKYLEGYTSIDKLGVRPRGVFYRQNEELDIIRDLGSITKQYARAKSSLIGHGKQDEGLQYIDENLPNEFSNSLKRIINGFIDNEKHNDVDDDDDDDDDDLPAEKPDFEHYENVQAIKTKAMKNAVKHINYLTGPEERQTTSKSPKKQSDMKQPSGKIKTSNLTKPVTTSPRKRKGGAKQRNKIIKETTKTETPTNDTKLVDINIEAFNKGTFVGIVGQEGNMKSVRGLKIETRPVTIQTQNQGHMIEIEIIDNQSIKNDKTVVEIPPSDAETSKFKKTYKGKRKSEIPEIINMTEVPEPKKLMKRAPRDLKRTKLKSKFKRQGMLQVANFNEQK